MKNPAFAGTTSATGHDEAMRSKAGEATGLPQIAGNVTNLQTLF